MARLSPARRVALSALSERRRRDGRMRDLLRTSDAMNALDAQDRALCSRLALGTVAAEGVLDEVLARYVKRPSSLEPRVRDALRLAAFEGLYLDTPASAVVSQGVELVRSVSPRAAGLANAVLRKVVDGGRAEVTEARERCGRRAASVDDLALVGGLPRWLVRHVRDARGEDDTYAMALAQLEAPPVYVAANRMLHGDDEAKALLEGAGLCPVATSLPGSFCLGRPAGLATSGLVSGVDVVVADLSAQQVAHLARPLPGQKVLEVGQGRGTKSVLLQNEALRSGGVACVEAVDSEPFKVELARRRMERAGLAGAVGCHVLDARTLASDGLPAELAGVFDLVFVDAPCSGTGTMRRHPEIAWSLEPSGLVGPGSLTELQLQILAAAATRVAPGGMLAYATCSVLPEEDEGIMEAFLASEAGREFSLRGEPFQSVPSLDGGDGHFCALIARA